MPLKSVEVNLSLPFGVGGLKGVWQPDQEEQRAAWEMYVELVTRIAVVDLGPGEGMLREALASLYSLFDITRGILRAHGPTVARAKGKGDYSFGYLAVIILNQVLRPVLAEWHPRLLDYENQRPSTTSQMDHERVWSHNEELRGVLREIRPTLEHYAEILAQVAGVPSLLAVAVPRESAETGRASDRTESQLE